MPFPTPNPAKQPKRTLSLRTAQEEREHELLIGAALERGYTGVSQLYGELRHHFLVKHGYLNDVEES